MDVWPNNFLNNLNFILLHSYLRRSRALSTEIYFTKMEASASDYFAAQPIDSLPTNYISEPNPSHDVSPDDLTPTATTQPLPFTPIHSPKRGRDVRDSMLSPGSLLPVLNRERSPPPKSSSRESHFFSSWCCQVRSLIKISTGFLHGGPPLSELSSPSATLSSTTVSWRAFTDEEEARLQKAWASLARETRMQEGGKERTEAPPLTEVSDPGQLVESWQLEVCRTNSLRHMQITLFSLTLSQSVSTLYSVSTSTLPYYHQISGLELQSESFSPPGFMRLPPRPLDLPTL